MAKIITKMGACAQKRKPLGYQFVNNNGSYSLEGSFLISGASTVISPEEMSSNITVGTGFSRTGCKHCGNKYVYRCGGCGTFVCYNGSAQRNASCPICGAVADVPSASGNKIPTTSVSRSAGLGGKTVQLAQGEEVQIKFADDKKLSSVEVGVGWDPMRHDSMDVDSSVVLLSPRGDSRDLVYFGNLKHPSGCVVHHGDNLTGDDLGNGDDENITVNLSKVPQDRDRIVFVLNIFSGQYLDDVKNLYIRLYEPTSKQVLVEYKVNGNFAKKSHDNAMIIGMAFRKGGGWSFKAIGKPLNCSNIHTLSSICDQYLG